MLIIFIEIYLYLCLIEKNKKELIKVAETLNIEFINADLSKKSGIDEISQFIKENNIEGLNNCAGVGIKKSAIEIKSEAAKKLLDINVTAVTNLTKISLRKLSIQNKGFIINISSSAALQPIAYFADYGASKHLFLTLQIL